jgi:Oxidoreductase family, NAD-binding Rossmann fold
MRTILAAHGRHVSPVEDCRRRPDEDREHYRDRLRDALAATHSEVAWICLPPGEHVLDVCIAAFQAGLHVVAEKPWPYDADVNVSLADLAQRHDERIVGVHFEFCLLDSVAAWRQDPPLGTFNGRFDAPGPDRLGVPALENLGCHLLAIREHAVPDAPIGEIDCGYERERARAVWIDDPEGDRAHLDFTHNDEPIIQRYVDAFEAARDTGRFDFGLDFATRVAKAIASV